MDIWDAFANRCSIRKYSDQVPEEEKIKNILLAASMAPVGMGLYQNIHMTVVKKKEILTEIDRATAQKMGKADSHPTYDAPVLIVASASPGKIVIPGIRELNCGCIMENMMLAATEAGLGSVFLMAAMEVIRESDEIREKLNIPKGFVPAGVLGLGYPAESGKVKERQIRFEVNTVA